MLPREEASLDRLVTTAKEVLRSGAFRPKKRLSQHFLLNKRSIKRLIDVMLDLRPHRVADLGSGLGVITRLLADHVSYVVGVEVDRSLARLAKGVCGDAPNLEILVSDALLVLDALNVDSVFSNAPYHITGPLIASIARSNNVLKGVVVLQDEVARRLTAKPGSDDYGRITVLVQLLFEVKPLFIIPASHFYPRPEVSSRALSMIRVRRYSDELRALERVTRCLFAFRNKLLSKAIKKCFGNQVYTEALKPLMDKRVRQLSPEEFLELTRVIAATTGTT